MHGVLCLPYLPLSYYKSTQGEGGIRSPFVIKLPNAGNQTKTEIVDAFVHVNDMTPTFLEYAEYNPLVQHTKVIVFMQ